VLERLETAEEEEEEEEEEPNLNLFREDDRNEPTTIVK
jgi:hypothetical protein